VSWLRKAVNSVTTHRLDEIRNGLSFLGYRTKSGEDVSETTALQVSAVLCAARVIAEGMAQMPLRIMHKGAAPIEATDHWASGMFTDGPNEWQSSFDFVENAVFVAALAGDFYAIKVGQGTKSAKLLPIPMGHCSVTQGERGNDPYELIYRVSLKDGTFLEYGAAEIFHLRGPSLNNFTGIRPVLMAREAIGLTRALEKHQAILAGSGGRPSGILATPNALKPEQAKRLKETWDEKYGAQGEGGIAVLDLDWKFTTMTMTSVDAEHLATRKHQIEEIARIFRVFPQMLMQSDKTSTFASAQEFFRAHVVHTLGPWIQRFEGAINRDILGRRSGLFADFDEYNLMRGSFEEQADFFSKALGTGRPESAWMTRNEVRRRSALPPVEGGDVFPTGESNE
jgi:HK97 family phage portal protein